MRDEKQIQTLVRAVDAFDRKLVVVSKDFKVLAANQYARGLVPGGIEGRKCHEVLHGLDAPCQDCPVLDVVKTGRPASQRDETQALGWDMDTCLYCHPIPNGEPAEAFLVLDLNIPALGGLEGMLRRSNAFLKNLLLSSVDGVISADMTGKIMLFNDAAVKISGYTVEEALSRLNIRDVYPGDGAKDVMRKLRSDAFGGRGKLSEYEVTVIQKDGTHIPISLNASVIYENGREVATIGFFRDLRKRIEMQQALDKAQVQLLQAEKMGSLGKLAAGVAHQLNNPLGGIILFAQLILEEYELEEGAQSDLSRILEDAQRCRDIVKELLEFARQTRQEIRPHDINRAISRTLFLLENQAIFQNIEIVKDLAEKLAPVPADIQQMNHLFMNIILNAAEAMEGKGRLAVRIRPSAEGRKAEIEISDTGPGIPEDVLPHIFEPFFTTKEEGKGTGLGLSLVYGIVENHRGSIQATSEPGKGTTFFIELPLVKANGGGHDPE